MGKRIIDMFKKLRDILSTASVKKINGYSIDLALISLACFCFGLAAKNWVTDFAWEHKIGTVLIVFYAIVWLTITKLITASNAAEEKKRDAVSQLWNTMGVALTLPVAEAKPILQQAGIDVLNCTGRIPYWKLPDHFWDINDAKLTARILLLAASCFQDQFKRGCASFELWQGLALELIKQERNAYALAVAVEMILLSEKNAGAAEYLPRQLARYAKSYWRCRFRK